MLRKLILLALLALNTAAVVSVANADLPLPHCYPCPGDPKVVGR